MKQIISIILFILYSTLYILHLKAQPAEYKLTPEEYIEKYKNDAIKEMLMHDVPASITLSQGMLESGNGNSPLAIYANNHFGIKCHGWDGLTFIQDDDERDECFRKYSSVLESYNDHSKFLRNRFRYAFLFKLKRTDYKGWAKGLKQAGYATNPKYPKLLTDIIERYNLHEFDKVEKMPSITPEPEELAAKPMFKGRGVILNNNVKYIVVKEGDSYFKIVNDFDMMLWQIFKYNDLKRNDRLKAGQIIYLQPKRKKAKYEYHIVKTGESMHSISQKYAIKLKHLYSKNSMREGSKPKAGQRLWLKKRKPTSA